MSQRFVVTPAAGGVGHPDPAAAPEPPRVDELPILRYGREPSRYGRCGRCGGTGTSPRGCAGVGSGCRSLWGVRASVASRAAGRWQERWPGRQPRVCVWSARVGGGVGVSRCRESSALS